MKWLLLIGATFAALVIVIVVIGALLPQSHVASRTARLSKPPAEVFAIITDFAALPTWRKGLKKVEVLSATEWRENSEMTLEVIERVEATKLVTRIKPGLPFGGTWTYALTADGEGTSLTITEHGEVYNPVFRFVSRYLMGHTATIDAYLNDLTKKIPSPPWGRGSG